MVLIIDGNNLFYRFCSYLAWRNEKFLERDNDDRVLMNAVYANINNTTRNLGLLPEAIFFTADSTWNWREKLDYPEVQYKAKRVYSEKFDREKLREIIHRFGNLMKNNNGWCLSQIPGYEGDDMLCLISDYYYKKNISSLILSSDGDARQRVAWNGNNYITVFDTQSDKMNHYIHTDFGGGINGVDDEFGGIFNVDKYDDSTTYILNSAHIRMNPIEAAFVKIIGGDSGDNVPSVYTKKTSTDKIVSFGNGYASSLFTKKKYNNDVIIRLFNDEAYRRQIAGDIISHMKSHELAKIGQVADNILRNIKYVFLDAMVYTDEQHTEITNHIENYITSVKQFSLDNEMKYE